ncbi:MAG: GTPase ObgE [Verrucomicrobia bacterium]|nr:GTPase ObgE [Verrucomicrobiota bacterium]MCF7708730.1 GTPase ObgE [Verrucomicrobiota bacterium]
MFIDEIKVLARAGHGGRGCVSFLREAFKPKGGPDGGNGGRGGNVILEASHDINNLLSLFYSPRLIAQNGDHGKGKGMDGRAGKDCIIKVPCGTLVWQLTDNTTAAVDSAAQPPSATAAPTTNGIKAVEYDLSKEEETYDSEKPRKSALLADLSTHGQRFVLCNGGRGGRGNRTFATSTRRAPKFAQPGEPGEEGFFFLELRILADIGLVGYPNAGKSTLLTNLSHARPKIAAYPFTTLHPQVGVLEYPDFSRLTVCDVPGLIKDAWQNAGLGHSFLKHISRCKALTLVIDMAGVDGRNPWDDYSLLLKELELYDNTLVQKPRLITANKMDLPEAPKLLREFKSKVPDSNIIPISAENGMGIDDLKNAMRNISS